MSETTIQASRSDGRERPDKWITLELYKAYLATTENTSSRRQATNAAFLTANTIIFAAYTFLAQQKFQFKEVVPAFGVFLSCFWLLSLVTYRKINKVKFEVLERLEAKLDVHVFAMEWEMLQRVNPFRLSVLEMSLPFGMFVLHLIAFFLFRMAPTGP